MYQISEYSASLLSTTPLRFGGQLFFKEFLRVLAYALSMLTKLTPQRPFIKTSAIKSPPSRALANYVKASHGNVSGPTDSVLLSEQAKSKPQAASGMRKIGTFVALGLSFVGILGAAGCSGGPTATPAVQPETESVQDTVQNQEVSVDLSQEQTSQSTRTDQTPGERLHKNLKGKSAEEIAETIGQEGRKVGEQVVDGVKEGGERLKDIFKDKDAEEVAESIGEEGRRIGKQIGEEGKKLGQDAAKVGKEVGNVAKGFWRGLTGKGKK
jgi:hypothetical protein